MGKAYVQRRTLSAWNYYYNYFELEDLNRTRVASFKLGVQTSFLYVNYEFRGFPAFSSFSICPPVLFGLQLLMFHIPQEIRRCHSRQLMKSTREFNFGLVFSYNDIFKTQSANSGVQKKELQKTVIDLPQPANKVEPQCHDKIQP